MSTRERGMTLLSAVRAALQRLARPRVARDASPRGVALHPFRWTPGSAKTSSVVVRAAKPLDVPAPPALEDARASVAERLHDGHIEAYGRLVALATGRAALADEVATALASRERTQGLLELARARDLSPAEYDETRRVELLELLRESPVRANAVERALARVSCGYARH